MVSILPFSTKKDKQGRSARKWDTPHRRGAPRRLLLPPLTSRPHPLPSNRRLPVTPPLIRLCPSRLSKSVAGPQHPQPPSVTPSRPPETHSPRYGPAATCALSRYVTLDRTYRPLSMNVVQSTRSDAITRRAGYAPPPPRAFSPPFHQTPYLPAPVSSIRRYGKPFDRSLSPSPSG